MSKYILNAVKRVEGREQPYNFQITFEDGDLRDSLAEIAVDLQKQGWDVKTMKEMLLPWDLREV